MDDLPLTGGCQCGAVRWAVDARPEGIHVCHCRMCQKQVGGPFAVICPVRKTAFRITRGAFAWFASSGVARRGFCRDCGTPLAFDYPHAPDLGLMAGTFDRPDLVPPTLQCGIEGRLPWFHGLPDLPGDQVTYQDDPDGMLPRIAGSNRQHPDHDTDRWPPGGAAG